MPAIALIRAAQALALLPASRMEGCFDDRSLRRDKQLSSRRAIRSIRRFRKWTHSWTSLERTRIPLSTSVPIPGPLNVIADLAMAFSRCKVGVCSAAPVSVGGCAFL
jgi:hypothetical protein